MDAHSVRDRTCGWSRRGTGELGRSVDLSGSDGDDRAAGDNFAPTGNASGNGGDDFITEAERTTADNLADGLSAGDGGDDTIRGCIGCVGDNQSFTGETAGTGGNDTITSGPGPDFVHGDHEAAGAGGAGGGGNDDISTLGGADFIDGGPATDRCNGGAGRDSAVNCETQIDIP